MKHFIVEASEDNIQIISGVILHIFLQAGPIQCTSKEMCTIMKRSSLPNELADSLKESFVGLNR